LKKYIVILAMTLLASQARAAEHRCSGSFCFQPQASTACLKPQVWGILHRLASNIGRLEITAGCNGRHARHSFHYRGMAVDFRPMQSSQGSAMAVLRADPAVGGVISEGRGLVHVDIGHRGFGKYVAYQHGGRHHRHYAALGRHYGRHHHRHVRFASR
jgi:hypothetical protein